MSPIRVVAAVIERDARWLMGRRPENKRHGGLWEFPGGKVDPGETPFEAARRELFEELELQADEVGLLLMSVDDGGSPFVIDFFQVSVSGTPEALEHSEIGWFSLDELRDLPLAPGDTEYFEWLSERAR